jgi:glucose/arabinose dehydrogenase
VELQLSTPVKLVVVLGIALAVVGGGAMTLLGRGGEAEAGVFVPRPLVTPKRAPSPAKAAPAKATTKPAAKPKRAAKPETAAKPEPAAQPKPARTPAAVTPTGLPVAVATALESKRVVVVALFSPGSAIDELALAEAQAGAKAAGAGFVAVNVLREGQGRAMARLLGVTDSPTLLVYRAPGTLTFRLDGFADLDTVAQAALDAPRGAGA